MAARIRRDKALYAECLTREEGKPFKESVDEVSWCATAIDYYAELARHQAGRFAGATVPGQIHFSIKEPLGTVAIILNSPYVGKEERNRYQREYCAGSKFRKAAKRFPEASQERWLTYILKTGANWAGPITDFKLTVDKGSPNNLVSFCGTGVTKISPTRFEMRAKNFTPRNQPMTSSTGSAPTERDSACSIGGTSGNTSFTAI